jgi:hypothetical protein
MHPLEVRKLKENDIKHELPPAAMQCLVILYCSSIDQVICKELQELSVGLLLLWGGPSLRVQPSDCRNEHQRRSATRSKVVRVNANHVQFARDDLGSLVLSSPHQTQLGLRDSTVPSFSRGTFVHFQTRLHVCFFDQPCVRLHSIDHRCATRTDCSCLLP